MKFSKSKLVLPLRRKRKFVKWTLSAIVNQSDWPRYQRHRVCSCSLLLKILFNFIHWILNVLPGSVSPIVWLSRRSRKTWGVLWGTPSSTQSWGYNWKRNVTSPWRYTLWLPFNRAQLTPVRHGEIIKVVRNSFPFSITTELYERFTRL